MQPRRAHFSSVDRALAVEECMYYAESEKLKFLAHNIDYLGHKFLSGRLEIPSHMTHPVRGVKPGNNGGLTKAFQGPCNVYDRSFRHFRKMRHP